MTTTELRALMAAATPGPWAVDKLHPYWILDGENSDWSIADIDKREDAALIVALVNSAEALLCKADKYDELLYAVQNKVPGESRHESALRCITQWETSQRNEPEQAND